MLEHNNIAALVTNLPAKENLQFLYDVIITADHFIRFHDRNTKVIISIIICIQNKNWNFWVIRWTK
jgi:hypothetical protein